MAFSTLLNTNPNSWRGEFVKQSSELRDNWDFTQVLPHCKWDGSNVRSRGKWSSSVEDVATGGHR